MSGTVKLDALGLARDVQFLIIHVANIVIPSVTVARGLADEQFLLSPPGMCTLEGLPEMSKE